MINNASLESIDTQRLTVPIRHSAGSNYFDLQGLAASAKRDAENSSTGNKAALHKIGGQFESMLLQQMLKTMRSATNSLFKDSLFSTHRVKFYQDMLDSQLMQDVVQRNSIGLAEQFVNNLSRDVFADDILEDDILEDDIVANNLANDGFITGDKAIELARSDSLPLLSVSTRNAFAESIASVDGRSGQDDDRATLSATVESSADNDFADTEFNLNTQQSPSVSATHVEKSKGEETSVFRNRAISFVSEVLPAALPVAQKLGLKVSQLLAQTVLETGWGRHIIEGAAGDSSFNLFGIKASEDWQGEVARTVTTEYVDGSAIKVSADFRHYSSYEESFADFLQFITSKRRYAEVLDQPPENFYFALQSAGYATDPNYADKIYDIAARIESQILPKVITDDSNIAEVSR